MSHDPSQNGDYLKALGSYADYYPGYGWYGGQGYYTMVPHKMYMLYTGSDHTLIYPDSNPSEDLWRISSNESYNDELVNDEVEN